MNPLCLGCNSQMSVSLLARIPEKARQMTELIVKGRQFPMSVSFIGSVDLGISVVLLFLRQAGRTPLTRIPLKDAGKKPAVSVKLVQSMPLDPIGACSPATLNLLDHTKDLRRGDGSAQGVIVNRREHPELPETTEGIRLLPNVAVGPSH